MSTSTSKVACERARRKHQHKKNEYFLSSTDDSHLNSSTASRPFHPFKKFEHYVTWPSTTNMADWSLGHNEGTTSFPGPSSWEAHVRLSSDKESKTVSSVLESGAGTTAREVLLLTLCTKLCKLLMPRGRPMLQACWFLLGSLATISYD